jgi:hypothetical protein
MIPKETQHCTTRKLYQKRIIEISGITRHCGYCSPGGESVASVSGTGDGEDVVAALDMGERGEYGTIGKVESAGVGPGAEGYDG